MFKAIFSKLRKEAGIESVEVNASEEDLQEYFANGGEITKVYTFKEMGVDQLADEADHALQMYAFVKKHKVLKTFPNLHILKNADHPHNVAVGNYVVQLQRWAMIRGIQLCG